MRQLSLSVLMVLPLTSCILHPTGAFEVRGEEHLGRYVETNRKEFPTLIVDLDDTVAHSGFWGSLKLVTGAGKQKQLPEAAIVLGRVAPSWNIVYVTARDSGLASRTAAWLEDEGFPPAPIVFSGELITGSERQREYKSKALTYLESRGLRLRAGIGDRPSDIAAYHDHDLHAFLIVQDTEDQDFVAAFDQREGRLDEHPTTMRSSRDRIFFGFDGAWPAIERELKALRDGSFGRTELPGFSETQEIDAFPES